VIPQGGMKNTFSTVNLPVRCTHADRRPSLQQKCAVLGLFFKLASVVAGACLRATHRQVDRLKTAFNQRNQGLNKQPYHSRLTFIVYFYNMPYLFV